jgi:hypothetical protein
MVHAKMVAVLVRLVLREHPAIVVEQVIVITQTVQKYSVQVTVQEMVHARMAVVLVRLVLREHPAIAVSQVIAIIPIAQKYKPVIPSLHLTFQALLKVGKF